MPAREGKRCFATCVKKRIFVLGFFVEIKHIGVKFIIIGIRLYARSEKSEIVCFRVIITGNVFRDLKYYRIVSKRIRKKLF